MSNDEENTYAIRITSQGKIKNWVAFALKSFQENPEMPLTFQTFPPKASQDKTKTPGAPSKLASSITLAPRLVTVVEIVKREYLKALAANRSPRLKGLHQYNEIGMLEDEDVDAAGEGDAVVVGDADKERAEKIIDALSGKNHVRQTQTPYMQVTLSTSELPWLQARGATYQLPATRKLSKSAKARALKREKKRVEGAIVPAGEPSQPQQGPAAMDEAMVL